jgi:hypothetical protein
VEFHLPYVETSSAIEHIFVFISANYLAGGESLLTEDHWYIVEHILNFIGIFLFIHHSTFWCILSNISFNDACYY